MIMKKKLVIFDLDGTLLYSLEDLRDSVNYALLRFGYQQKSLDYVRASVGNGVGRLVRLCLPETAPDAEYERCLALFKEHYAAHCCDKTRPYDGIVEVLKQLKTNGIKVGILSNKYHSAAVEVVECYFKGLYDVVKGESATCRRKPAPDGVMQILEEYGMEKDDAVLFGDSEADIQTADNAGIEGVAVLWGFRVRKTLEFAGAKNFIESPSEILNFI